MNFLSMDYFLMVARGRSITRAAQQLHITQQTLSAHIAALEREVGTPLFLRRVPLELTYAGEVFLRHAQDIQGHSTALRRELDEIAGHRRGILRVGVAYTRGRILMPAILEAFQREYPNMEIHLRESHNESLSRWAADGEVDLSIAALPDTIQGLETEDFYRSQIILLIPRSLMEAHLGPDLARGEAALAAGDLSPLVGCPFLLGSPDDVNGRVGQLFIKRFSLRPQIRAQTENAETLLALCRRGMGACFCPQDFLGMGPEELARTGLQLFSLGPDAQFTIRFGYLKRSHQWSILSRFMEVARENLPPTLSSALL